MSITALCRCGKKFHVKNSAAGKKFKCTACAAVVKVPDEQVDDLEEIDDEDDEWDDGELKIPVRKKKKRSSKAMSMAKGIMWEATKEAPSILIKIAGITIGISGYILGAYWLLLAGLALLGGNLIISAVFTFFVLTFFLGARAATGGGLKVSRELVWNGNGSIIAGSALVVGTFITGAVIFAIMARAIR